MKAEYNIDPYVDYHFSSKSLDYNEKIYRYITMNADMDDLATFHKAMLFLKGFYQDELHKTDSAFSEHYLNKWIKSLTLKIQAMEYLMNKLESKGG